MAVQYTIDEAVRELAAQVKSENSGTYDFVDLEKILFIRRSGSSGGKYYARVSTVTGPYRLLAGNIQYILEINDTYFSRLSTDAQKKVVEHEFHHLPLQMDGKLIRHDVNDFQIMLTKYGVDYLQPVQD